jgi:uncharacterized protein YjbI with pentapeptide repeats
MVTIGKSILGEMRLYSSLTGRFSDRLLIKEGNPVVNLATADLRNADLSLDDLSDVDLGEAILRGADLRNADLSSVILRNADLGGAYLSYANLSYADLSNADLRAAQGVSESDLELQLVKLENTMMPDGSKHD